MVKNKERISLKDLKRSDEIENKTTENTNTVTVKKESKQSSMADYEKLSVSIPVDMFETLQDISRERRRVKQKHTMSHMVREALTLWLEHINKL